MDSNTNNKELDLKEILLIAKEYWNYLLSKLWIIILLSLIVGGIAGFWALKQPTYYIAKTTFVVDEENESGGSILPSALASFGFSSSSKDGLNLDKMISLSKSQKILFQSILSPIDTTTNTLLINEIMDKYNVGDEEFKMIPHSHFDSLSPTYKAAVRNVANLILEDKNDFLTIGYSENTRIVYIGANTLSPEISLSLINNLYDQLSDFYIKQAINKSQQTVSSLQSRLDSIANQLNKSEYQYASTIDRSGGVLFTRDGIDKYRLERDLEIGNASYIEVLKNLEASKFKLESITPYFTVIDSPFEPLIESKTSIFLYSFLGFLLTGMVVSIYILGQKAIKTLVD